MGLARLDVQCPKDRTLLANRAGFLIEVGNAGGDCHCIEEGISYGKAILNKRLPWVPKWLVHYDLANGHLDLERLKRSVNQTIADVYTSKPHQAGKEHLRLALEDTKSASPRPGATELTRIWVNYGNILDGLGRGIEAITAYDEALRVFPGYPMATGNKALALLNFAGISGAYTSVTVARAYVMLVEAASDERVVASGGEYALGIFHDVLNKLQTHFGHEKLLELGHLDHKLRTEKNESAFLAFHTKFCLENHLFLNLHIHEDSCGAAKEDSIFIRRITAEISDPLDWASYLNEIKESYMASRWLMTTAILGDMDLETLTKSATFADTLDYAENGLRIGLVKSSFKEAFGVFDKIAGFLNYYLKIGIDPKRVYFDAGGWVPSGSIWENNDRIVRLQVLGAENRALLALYDIYRDLNRSPRYAQLLAIRNSLTHRRLKVTTLGGFGYSKKSESIRYSNLVETTIFLLQLTRAAVIYLVNFGQQREKDE